MDAYQNLISGDKWSTAYKTVNLCSYLRNLLKKYIAFTQIMGVNYIVYLFFGYTIGTIALQPRFTTTFLLG
jgi:hypothetical protein